MGATCSCPKEPTASENVEVDLFDLDSLVRWIEWADIGLLDTNWLRGADKTDILHRRQELPPEAFVPVRDLRHRPIVALSYGWADPANPDPKGQYAAMLKGYFQDDGKLEYLEGAALFWDHKSLYQHRLRPDWDGRRETFAKSLIQGRTPAEEVKFRRAMHGMQAFYFHAHVGALIAEAVPWDGRNPRPYEQRGWTAMECAGACLSGRAIPLDSLGNVDIFFDKALVPMSLEDFEEVVARRTFFREEDRPEVVRMYRDGFAAYARSSKELVVNVGDADPEKVARLTRALPRFERLVYLHLKGYPRNPRSPELDEVLDALVRRGCRVFAGWTSSRQPMMHHLEWLPDGPPRAFGEYGEPNPAWRGGKRRGR